MKHAPTRTQKELLDFIIQFYKVYDYRPSLRDMSEGKINNRLVIKSRTRQATWRVVQRLIEKQWLEQRFFKNVAYWVPAD